MEHKNSIAGIRRLPLVFAIVVALTTAAIADVHATAQEVQQKAGSVSEATLSLPTPEHKKYVSRNADGTYGLTLTVKGGSSSQSSEYMKDREPVDIVLVTNGSDSMRQQPTGSAQTYWRSVMDATKLFAEGLLFQGTRKLQPPSGTVKLASIIFGKGTLFNTGLTSSPKEINESFFYRPADHSQAGPHSSLREALDKAREVLEKGRSGVAKYIILMTDGTASSDDTVLAQLPEGMKLFVVNMGDSGGPGIAQLKQLAQGTGGFYAGKESGLDAALRKIILTATVKTLSYADVKITDQLSDYVRPVGDVANLMPIVEAIDEHGNSVKGTDKAAKRMNAKYDAGERKLTLDFGAGTRLTHGVTYQVTLTIEPSDTAHQEYARTNGQYPHTGDNGTDAPNMSTSSGKQGFYSNRDAATLTYSTMKWTDAKDTVVGTQQTATYDKPVIQVTPTTVTLVTKVDNTYAGKYGATPSHWNLSAMNGQGTRNPMTPSRRVIPAGTNDPDMTQMATQTTLVAPGSYSLGYERGRGDYPYFDGYEATWTCVGTGAGEAGLVGLSGSSDPDPGQHEQPLPPFDPGHEKPIPFGPGDFHFPGHSDTIPFDGDLTPGPFSPPRPNPLAPDPGPGNNLVLNTVDNPQITVKHGQNVVCTVTFRAKPGKLTWDKVDERGKLLGGSHWSLTSTDVADFTTKTVGDNGNEDEDKAEGKFAVTGLKWGEYKLVETKAPDGYTPGNPLMASVLPVDGVMQEGSLFTVHAGNAVNHKTAAADTKPGKPSKPSKPSPGKPGGLAATGAWVAGGVTVMMLTLAAAGAVLLVRRKFMH